jgi:phenylacetate-CoA ligase
MEEIFWDKEIETISKEELKKLQLFRLNELLNNACQSLYYKSVFREKNLSSFSLKSLDDVKYLPFTTREDLLRHYPFGLLTVEKEDIIRFHTNSGAYAPKKGIFYSKDDIAAWSALVARSFYTAGVRETDIIQALVDFELYSSGFGCQLGGEELGAMVIPSGNFNLFRQIQLMRELGTTVLYIPPGILPNLLDTFYDHNLDPHTDTELRIIILGEEPVSLANKITAENSFGLQSFNSYGILEINSPAMAIECSQHEGMHIWEDYYYIEIIDPKTLQPVKDGEWGELVITTLNQEAMPLIRFRTGDITRIIADHCHCGRTHRKIDFISSRTDDLFFISGHALYPAQIETTLKYIPEVGDNYVIYLEKIDNRDELVIEIEVADNLYLDNYGKLETIKKYISSRLYEETKVFPIIKLVQNNYFNMNNIKYIKKVVDKRK